MKQSLFLLILSAMMFIPVVQADCGACGKGEKAHKHEKGRSCKGLDKKDKEKACKDKKACCAEPATDSDKGKKATQEPPKGDKKVPVKPVSEKGVSVKPAGGPTGNTGAKPAVVPVTPTEAKNPALTTTTPQKK